MFELIFEAFIGRSSDILSSHWPNASQTQKKRPLIYLAQFRVKLELHFVVTESSFVVHYWFMNKLLPLI